MLCTGTKRSTGSGTHHRGLLPVLHLFILFHFFITEEAAQASENAGTEKHDRHPGTGSIPGQPVKKRLNAPIRAHKRFKHVVCQKTAQENPGRNRPVLDGISHGKDAPLHILRNRPVENYILPSHNKRNGDAGRYAGNTPYKNILPCSHQKIAQQKGDASR